MESSCQTGVPWQGNGQLSQSLDSEWAEITRRLRLTRRESQVLRGIWSCHKRARIAADLGIAIPTVDTHWTALKPKLKAGSHNEACKIVDALLAELRLKAITDPLYQTIASLRQTNSRLQQQVRELEEQVDADRQAKKLDA